MTKGQLPFKTWEWTNWLLRVQERGGLISQVWVDNQEMGLETQSLFIHMFLKGRKQTNGPWRTV